MHADQLAAHQARQGRVALLLAELKKPVANLMAQQRVGHVGEELLVAKHLRA